MRGVLTVLAACTVAAVGPAVRPAPASGSGSQDEAGVRRALVAALPLIAAGAAGYTRERPCFSCHHQAMGIMALTAAKRSGVSVDAAAIDVQVRFTEGSLKPGIDGFLKGRGQGGAVTTAGYALLGLQDAGWKPDTTTAAVVAYLLQANAADGHWRTSASRPPSEASDFTDTYLAVRGLRAYATPEQTARAGERIDAAREWLEKATAKDTEDRVFRLLGLKAAGAGAEMVASASRSLLDAQRPDGGWSQTADRESDAYATGSALVALHQAGGLPVTGTEYRRGLAFLVRTQLPDGSWHVRSRSRPFQTYFESGFPHGADQFISMAGSCWAATAFALAVPTQE